MLPYATIIVICYIYVNRILISFELAIVFTVHFKCLLRSLFVLRFFCKLNFFRQLKNNKK